MGTVCLFIFSSFPGSLPMFCLVVGSAAGIREHEMEYFIDLCCLLGKNRKKEGGLSTRHVAFLYCQT